MAKNLQRTCYICNTVLGTQAEAIKMGHICVNNLPFIKHLLCVKCNAKALSILSHLIGTKVL